LPLFLRMLPTSPTPWLHCCRPAPAARLRLYAFPYAGGGAAVYFSWAAFLAPEIELWAVRLPGRETRLREPGLTSFAAVLAALEQEVAPRLRPPCAFFGHSLGALIAFEFTRRLQARSGGGPLGLIVSGSRAPAESEERDRIGDLPDDRFVVELRDRYNGIPPAVLQHPELLQLVLPLLRADVRLFEDYRYSPGPKVRCPLVAFGGAADPLVSTEQVQAWQALATAGFRSQIFPGDHFFTQSAAAAVTSAVKQTLLERFAVGV